MTDKRFTSRDKEAFGNSIILRINSPNPDLKAANKRAAQKTVENMARRMQDTDDILYNPALLGELVVGVANSKKVRKQLKRILKARNKEDLEEVGTRNFLYGMLMVFGNGQRAGTIENMTCGEFVSCELVEGVECVRVAKHKTAQAEGPASVVFAILKLWSATNNYIRLFR